MRVTIRGDISSVNGFMDRFVDKICPPLIAHNDYPIDENPRITGYIGKFEGIDIYIEYTTGDELNDNR